MPLNSISKDSEASNAPASLKTNSTLQQLDADNAILKLKKKILDLGGGKVTIEISLIQGASWKYPPSSINSSFCAVLSLILSKP